jgi:hypothetical protein
MSEVFGDHQKATLTHFVGSEVDASDSLDLEESFDFLCTTVVDSVVF